MAQKDHGEYTNINLITQEHPFSGMWLRRDFKSHWEKEFLSEAIWVPCSFESGFDLRGPVLPQTFSNNRISSHSSYALPNVPLATYFPPCSPLVKMFLEQQSIHKAADLKDLDTIVSPSYSTDTSLPGYHNLITGSDLRWQSTAIALGFDSQKILKLRTLFKGLAEESEENPFEVRSELTEVYRLDAKQNGSSFDATSSSLEDEPGSGDHSATSPALLGSTSDYRRLLITLTEPFFPDLHYSYDGDDESVHSHESKTASESESTVRESTSTFLNPVDSMVCLDDSATSIELEDYIPLLASQRPEDSSNSNSSNSKTLSEGRGRSERKRPLGRFTSRYSSNAIPQGIPGLTSAPSTSRAHASRRERSTHSYLRRISRRVGRTRKQALKAQLGGSGSE